MVYLLAPERVERLGFQLPVVGYLNLLNIILPMLFVLQAKRTDKRAGFWLVLAVVSLLTTPFAGIKSYFVQSALGIGVVLLYDTGRVRISQLAIAGGIVTLVILGYFAFYNSYFKEDTASYVESGTVNVPKNFGFLGRPLLYVAGPISTFGAFARFQDELFWGKATLLPLSRVAGAFEPVHIPSKNGKVYSIPVSFNTYTLFRESYEDARELGILLFGFVLGVLTQALYFQMRAHPSIFMVSACSYVTVALVLGPFGSFLTTPKAAYFLILLLVLHQMESTGATLFRNTLASPERRH